MLQKQDAEKTKTEPVRNTALTTAITERETNQGWCKERELLGCVLFLEPCTQIIQLQLSAGLHNRNTVGQIWPNVFSARH